MPDWNHTLQRGVKKEMARERERKGRGGGEVNLKFTQAHQKQKRKESSVVTVTVRGNLLKLNLLRLESPCPDFSLIFFNP